MPSPHILNLSPHRLCISLHFWCAVLLTITGKRLTFFSCSSCLLHLWDYMVFIADRILWVFSCSVASHGIVGCSSQYWLLLFFLRFQLMLGTASSWLGQSLVVFDVVFLNVGLPSIVSARFCFQDLIFGVLTSMLSFIARGRLHSLLISFRLPFPFYSCISLQLSSHVWWLSLSPCLPLEVWIMFSFVHVIWAWSYFGFQV